MGKQITLIDGKTEYFAFYGTKRLLGINPLAGRIESRSGQIWRQFGGICNFSWHRICVYTKKTTALLCFGRRGAVGGKRKCIMFEQKTPKGVNTFIFRVQRY